MVGTLDNSSGVNYSPLSPGSTSLGQRNLNETTYLDIFENIVVKGVFRSVQTTQQKMNFCVRNVECLVPSCVCKCQVNCDIHNRLKGSRNPRIGIYLLFATFCGISRCASSLVLLLRGGGLCISDGEF